MLCEFPLQSKVIQLYLYIAFLFVCLFSIMADHRILNTVFCTIQ